MSVQEPTEADAFADDRLEAARAVWFDHNISGEEAAKRTGIGQRTLYRYFGKRDTPAFGAALNKRRARP